MRTKNEIKEIDLNGFELASQHLVMARHLNPANKVFGGTLLSWLDTDLYIYAAGLVGDRRFVTFSMQNIYFRNPANLGDFIQIYARIKEVKRSRVVTEGKALAFFPSQSTKKLIIECEITYVVIDETGKPRRVTRDHFKSKNTT